MKHKILLMRSESGAQQPTLYLGQPTEDWNPRDAKAVLYRAAARVEEASKGHTWTVKLGRWFIYLEPTTKNPLEAEYGMEVLRTVFKGEAI